MQRTKKGRLAAVALGFTLLAAACGSDEKKADPTDAPTTTAAAAPETAAAGGDVTTTAAETPASGGAEGTPTGVTCDGATLAFIGALSGDNGALGTNMINGASIAIDEFNEANPDCQVTFKDKDFDSQGDPAQATPLATTIANDDEIIGLIGPGFSGETKATMPTFETAGLPMITPGATNALLSQNGWKMFHRVLANDDLQAPGVVTLIQNVVKGTKVGVIDDASDYGKGLAESVRTGLGDLLVADATIDPKAADYSAAVTAMKDAAVDVVFYSGYYAEAAKMVQQLRDAGVEATFVSGDGALDPGFVENAGDAADGAYLTATGAPPDVNPEFTEKFEAKFGTPPALYSPEAYDAANVFLDGIAAGNVTREALATFIDGYDSAGITKQVKFAENGEPEGSAVFYTLVEGGALVSKGLVP